MGNEQLDQWWSRNHGALMEILYRHDPDGMGASVGAPDDEYFDAATTLMRALRDRPSEDGPGEVVLEVWPQASPEMLADIEAAWERPPSGQGKIE